MIPLYDPDVFIQASGGELLPFRCEHCAKTFYYSKTYVQSIIKTGRIRLKYCSNECKAIMSNKCLDLECTLCKKSFKRAPGQIKKVKNVFCNNSCATKYNNAHKTFGHRRSKLEVWIEERLCDMYPTLDIRFNEKSAINAELDIYIPSLEIAFELNGIFHYEPIYGIEKMKSILNNDNRKFQACLNKGIELCIIDTSLQKYVKPKHSQKYLDIIVRIIDCKISTNNK